MKPPPKILITGATGCIGQQLVERFLTETSCHLVLIVRDPRRLRLADRHKGRITMITGDLRDPEELCVQVPSVDALVLCATAWGGDDTARTVVGASEKLADHAISVGCRHVLYFSTASVLDRSGDLLPEARTLGTPYIQAKLDLVEAMERRATRVRVTGVFPTLVLGGVLGDVRTRVSHFANLLKDSRRYTWLIRHFNADARFHLVHAVDVAAVVHALLAQDPEPSGASRHVLGAPALSLSEILEEFCRHQGTRHLGWFKLRPAIAELFIRIFRIRLSRWDRFCMSHPDQSFEIVEGPESFGKPASMTSVAAGLDMIGLRSGKRHS